MLNMFVLYHTRYCFRCCLAKQRTACIINVWGYTEILPKIVLEVRGFSFICQIYSITRYFAGVIV